MGTDEGTAGHYEQARTKQMIVLSSLTTRNETANADTASAVSCQRIASSEAFAAA